MDYVVGSVAALVSGNVTPNRPKLLKRARTPTKHQSSPNVTPKSEVMDDRSIFLSPSLQKKKAVVKKSPKRIFQNPDLDHTENGEEGSTSLTSPKADKVKKHLQDELTYNSNFNKSKQDCILPSKSKNKKEITSVEKTDSVGTENNTNKSTPKKKQKLNKPHLEVADNSSPKQTETPVENITSNSPKKMNNRRKSVLNDDHNEDNDNTAIENETSQIVDTSPKKQNLNLNNFENVEEKVTLSTEDKSNTTSKKKNKKHKKKAKQNIDNPSKPVENMEVKDNNMVEITNSPASPKKKNRKRKKSKSQPTETLESELPSINKDEIEKDAPSKKVKTMINPNAVTDKETDSEHESDDDIESENEEINKKVFESEPNVDESSEDENDGATKKEKPQNPKAEKKKEINNENKEVNTEEEIKRTLFVGNVPFSSKCKKEIKKIFNKHGQIETIRIRTVPVKDGRYTPKLAVIKNELHPERTTVNVYIKYVNEESVQKALAENNTVLNDHHLRVSRSSHTGQEHDPKCSIFIGNLPFAMEDEALRQKFEKCGEIESVRIIRDKKTNAGKGFGYVNFVSKDGVELALALTEEDLTIKNRIIRVKRCTQLTNKQKQSGSHNKRDFKNQSIQGTVQGNRRMQGQNQSHQKENQGFRRGYQSGPREERGFQRGNQGGFRGNQGFIRANQNSQSNQGFVKGNQSGRRVGSNEDDVRDGAHRRIMHKRKSQDTAGEGPPNKMQKNVDQPNKEKKSKKEFVGMTAEKKKKRKFDKGLKKKKALSEILTK